MLDFRETIRLTVVVFGFSYEVLGSGESTRLTSAKYLIERSTSSMMKEGRGMSRERVLLSRGGMESNLEGRKITTRNSIVWSPPRGVVIVSRRKMVWL